MDANSPRSTNRDTSPGSAESTVPRRRVAEYVRRAETLRQIHGNKASRAQRAETTYLVVTVFVATIVTAFGFAGPARIADALPQGFILNAQNEAAIEMIFNLAVLLILVLTLVGLVYRNAERANRHFRSVEVLTDFLRDWEDAIALHDAGLVTIDLHRLQIAGERYKGLLSALPPNTDREWRKAKRDAKRKLEQRLAARAIEATTRLRGELAHGSSLDSSPLDAALIATILQRDAGRMVALQTVSATLGINFWIVGGFVREAVWDWKQGFRAPAALGEIDVVYFDASDVRKSSELLFRDRLRSDAPNLDWSVKNQSRMQTVNGHDEYRGLADALSRAPETASTVAVQLERGVLRVMSPVGLSDLMGMKLRPNTHGDPDAYRRRFERVQGAGRWADLSAEAPGLGHRKSVIKAVSRGYRRLRNMIDPLK